LIKQLCMKQTPCAACRQDLGPDKRPSLAVKYAQWDVTYAALCDALRSHKPDGLFGFSQGATATALFLASLLTAQRQGRDLDVPLPRFCVVVSAWSVCRGLEQLREGAGFQELG
jgi:hypothetical protein